MKRINDLKAAYVAGKLVQTYPKVVWNIRHSLFSIEKEKFFTRIIIRAGRSYSEKVAGVIYNSRVSRHQHESFGYASDNSLVSCQVSIVASKPLKSGYT